MNKPKFTVAELLSHYAPYNAPDVNIALDERLDVIFHYDALSGRELPEKVGGRTVGTFVISRGQLWIYTKEEEE